MSHDSQGELIRDAEHRLGVVCGSAQEKAGNCQNPAEEPHSCPYRSDVHQDDESLCTCCPDCQRRCADDI